MLMNQWFSSLKSSTCLKNFARNCLSWCSEIFCKLQVKFSIEIGIHKHSSLNLQEEVLDERDAGGP